MSDEFLRALSEDLAPLSRWYVARRLVLGMSGGVIVSAVLMLVLLGPRPDMDQSMATTMFWLKLSYALAFAVIAGFASERLARPAASARGWIKWLAVPILLAIVIAAFQLAAAAPDSRAAMVVGQSARVCPWRILFFALPPLAGLVWAMRGLAPTRLREAGAAIGLAAGGAGAFIYALHCTESTTPFLAIWYTLGMTASAAIGWALGPFVLRWR
jgi:hypothetical protein